MKGFRLVPLVYFITALLLHAAPPTITSQPQDQTVNVASSVQFTVAADNAVAYQWQFNGGSIPGETNATLWLENLGSNQIGGYSVIVFSSDDNVTSRTAQLSLISGTQLQLKISGFPGGGSSNVVIRLFDHDKPATVANFIHYIRTGAYTNMFFDRLIPDFVLQGGSWDTVDRTNTLPQIAGYNVYSSYVSSLQVNNPPLPTWIDNEFAVGPRIHNIAGTLAMAKKAGDPDSAVNAFFFSLADNSTNTGIRNLDVQNSGFTVFGRIVQGQEVLDYFNNLAKNGHGIFDESSTDAGATFTDLPVNFDGLGTPSNTNLFYADFTFLTPPPTDSQAPTIAVSSVVTNGASVTVSGTASDNVGVARVVWTIAPVNQFNHDLAFGGNTTGSTNWSFHFGDLPPGNYGYNVISQDGSGNLATRFISSFTIGAFPLHVAINGNGKVTPNLDGQTLVFPSNVVMKAVPNRGNVFVNWTIGSNSYDKSTFTFTNVNGGNITANFAANNFTGGFTMASPAANAKLTNPVVTFSGAVKKGTSAQITLVVFNRETLSSVTNAITVNATGTWSIPFPALAPGHYIAQAVATDPNGRNLVISHLFDVLAPLSITVVGPGSVGATNRFLEIGQKYTITAVPKPKQSFLNWIDSSGISTRATKTFTMASGYSLTANFLANNLPRGFAITSPKVGQVQNSTNITVSGTLPDSDTITEVTCQIYAGTAPASARVAAVISGNTWSANLFSVPPGTTTLYAIAYDAQGGAKVISQSIIVNLFPSLAGTYRGLFIGSVVTPTTVGSVNVKITSVGAFSGTLQFPAFPTIPIHGKLNPNGLAAFSPATYNGHQIIVNLTLPLDSTARTLQGLVGQAGIWTANLFAYRQNSGLGTNTVPTPGKYVLLFVPPALTTNGPTASGYGLATIDSDGNLTMAGAMPDGATFTESANVSDYGYWPAFFVPSGYQKRGMVVGWEFFHAPGTNSIITNSAFSAIDWVKLKGVGPTYTGGFGMAMTSPGGQFIPPAPNTQYSFIFSGGNLTNSITNLVTVDVNGNFADSPVTSGLSLSADGQLSGNFSNPQTGETLSLQGGFINPLLGGGGFVPDNSGTSEGFLIQPVH